AETEFTLKENGSEIKFTVSPAVGDLSLIPNSRNYAFSFRDVTSADKISAISNGEEVDFTVKKTDVGMCVTVENVDTDKGVTVTVYSADKTK
ncbi:MAG TPA: hypothetical protein DCY31_01960, partial [Ruminococcaceae bacterium]|nr:hypothetical protein [Oscillospiraceae bacterium]